MFPECKSPTLCSWNMTPIILHVATNTDANFGYAGLGVQRGDSLRDSV